MDDLYDRIFDMTGDDDGYNQFEPSKGCGFESLCRKCTNDKKVMLIVFESDKKAMKRYLEY